MGKHQSIERKRKTLRLSGNAAGRGLRETEAKRDPVPSTFRDHPEQNQNLAASTKHSIAESSERQTTGHPEMPTAGLPGHPLSASSTDSHARASWEGTRTPKAERPPGAPSRRRGLALPIAAVSQRLKRCRARDKSRAARGQVTHG